MHRGHFRLIRVSAVKVGDTVMLARSQERIDDATILLRVRCPPGKKPRKVRTHNPVRVDAVFNFGSRVILRGRYHHPGGDEYHCVILQPDDYVPLLLGWVQTYDD